MFVLKRLNTTAVHNIPVFVAIYLHEICVHAAFLDSNVRSTYDSLIHKLYIPFSLFDSRWMHCLPRLFEWRCHDMVEASFEKLGQVHKNWPSSALDIPPGPTHGYISAFSNIKYN